MKDVLLILPPSVLVILFSVFSFSLAFQANVLFVLLFSLFLALPLPFLIKWDWLHNKKLKRTLRLMREALIGIYFYLMIFIAADAAIALFSCFHKNFSIKPFPLFFWSFLLFLFTLFCAMLQARTVKTVQKEVYISKNGPPFTKKFLVFSDLHLGAFTSKKHLIRLTKQISSANDVDAVFFLGDFFDGELSEIAHIDEKMEILKKIRQKNMWMCTGNHDNALLEDPNARILISELGFHILEDEKVDLNTFVLYGFNDHPDIDKENRSRIFKKDDRLTVVLDHRPKNGETDRQLGADLVLTGHTHGGQTFPATLLCKLFLKHCHNFKNNIFNTCGCGYWGIPLRLFIQNEIVILQVHVQ